MRPFLFGFLSFAVFFLSSCAHSQKASPSSSIPIEPDSISCEKDGHHQVFAILVDGADVGREVRTDFSEQGPDGRPRRFILSHSVKNEKLGAVIFQNIFVRQELTDPLTGHLFFTTFTKKDQVATHVVQITAQNEGFHRSIFSTSSFSDPRHATEDTVPLRGDEVIGFRLIDRVRACFLKKGSCEHLSFFDAQLNAPVTLHIGDPIPSTLSLMGRSQDGFWIEIRNAEKNSVLSRYFFDRHGTLFSEEYPELHESRVLVTGPISFPEDTSELLVGLRSNAYIYDPNIASAAEYQLIASPDRLDKLDMLGEPVGHEMSRISPTEIHLRVNAGAPDGLESPTDADLTSSMYVRPEDPAVKEALAYLKSAGKSGHLNEARALNATPVVAQVSLLPHPSKVWSDPDQSASLIMQYTSALLPDKRHTFSMSDAVATLDQGGGDCTEHAVLFASLMRAHHIPTRLVTGMLLTPGGIWAYHMWNAYWDGERWQPIDPSTLTFRPGALYVALGRGASYFKQVRERLADFMWRTFSGVSFNLIQASNEGEALILAKPNGHEKDLGETALFNAVVLSGRGDHEGALTLLDDHISEGARTLSVKLMRIELMINAGLYEKALTDIAEVRLETSAAENTFLLDRFELQCRLHLHQTDLASPLFDRLCSHLSDESEKSVLRAELLFYTGRSPEALSLLQQVISDSPNNIAALSSYARFIAETHRPENTDLSTALIHSIRAVQLSYYSDPAMLETLSRLLSETGALKMSSWYADHALTLAPDDADLRAFQKELAVEGAGCKAD